MKKFIWSISFIFLLFSCENSSNPVTENDYTKNLDHDSSFVGLWLEHWNYSEANTMWFPGSYGAADTENKQYDYFYYFKADGTGYEIMREMIIQDFDSHSFSNDVIYWNRKLYWGIEEGELRLYRTDYQGMVSGALFTFSLNPESLPGGKVIDENATTVDGYALSDILLVDNLTISSKLNSQDSQEFLTTYDLQ